MAGGGGGGGMPGHTLWLLQKVWALVTADIG